MRPPPGSPLFPYTTLFRSADRPDAHGGGGRRRPAVGGAGALAAGADGPERGAGGALALAGGGRPLARSEEHTSELQSQSNLVCRLLLEKKTPRSATTSSSR